MRRSFAYLIGIVLIAGAAAALFLATGTKSHSDKKSSPSSSQNSYLPAKKACQLFTLADAKQLLGDTAKGGQNPLAESSQDLEISTCTYTQDTGSNAPVTSRQSATLLMRAPKTNNGTISNQHQFGPLKPTNVQDVSGYGDNAYWDNEHGQLNILKNNTWYILSFGPITPAGRSLDQAKQLADILIDKL